MVGETDSTNDGARAEERLRSLKAEVGQMAETLAAMSIAAVRGQHEARAATNVSPVSVRSLIKAQSLRSNYISDVPLGDPAWEILLDLLAARLESKQVAASSLCIAAGIPSSSAMRLIDTLTSRGVIVRTRDPRDARRSFVELSGTAEQQLRRYLLAAHSLSSPAP
jgi:DNA-binding MarR family transcriptional regulator